MDNSKSSTNVKYFSLDVWKNVLKKIINDVHSENKLIRFWASPDNSNSWSKLQSEGVDLINTDKINQYSNYYHNTKN